MHWFGDQGALLLALNALCIADMERYRLPLGAFVGAPGLARHTVPCHHASLTPAPVDMRRVELPVARLSPMVVPAMPVEDFEVPGDDLAPLVEGSGTEGDRAAPSGSTGALSVFVFVVSIGGFLFGFDTGVIRRDGGQAGSRA